MSDDNFLSLSTAWIIENTLSVAVALLIIIAGWILAKFAARTVTRVLPHASGIDNTVGPLLAEISRYAVLVVAVVLALGQVGVQTASIIAVLGAAGVAIALALQGTLSNIAAGVMLIWLRPISTGEYIDADGVAGTVVEIGLFGTRLKTADGVYVFAPNSQIWNANITNYSREATRRFDLKIGIAYDADLAKAREILLKIANSDERLLKEPEPAVRVDSLADSAVIVMLRVWVPTADYWNVVWEFTEQAKLEFDKQGIEIPFNKLDLNLKSAAPIETIAEPAN